jgi:hypothetical protein
VWHVVREDRYALAQPRMHAPTSLDAELVRQSALQLRFSIRAILRQAPLCIPQAAGHGGVSAWAVSANITPNPMRLHSSCFVEVMVSPLRW